MLLVVSARVCIGDTVIYSKWIRVNIITYEQRKTVLALAASA